jgi:hypothetical protein
MADGELPMSETNTAVRNSDVAEKINAGESAVHVEAEVAAGEERESAATENEGENEDEHKPKRLGGFQRKLQKLEQERDVWRDEVLRTRLQAKANESQAKPAPEFKEPLEPNEAEFTVAKYGTAEKAWEAYRKAERAYIGELTEYKARKVVDERTKAEQQKAAKQSSEQRWKELETKTRAKRDDYADVCDLATGTLEKNKGTTADVISTAVIESDFGPELLYLLGEKPEELGRLLKLSPMRAALEMGKLESVIAQQESQTDEEEAVPAKGKPASPPPVSRAANPPTPIKKKSAAADDGELRDDLPTDVWKERFLKKLEKR